MLNSFLHS